MGISYEETVMSFDKVEFENMCYALYQYDWCRKHITDGQYKKAIISARDMDCKSVKEYVEKYGFDNGECYVCKDEFLANEYQNEDIMRIIFEELDIADRLLEDWKYFSSK